MLKEQMVSDPQSCLNRAGDDEPVFLIRAKDPVARLAVEAWASLSAGIHELPKLKEALRLAADMETWREQHASPNVEQQRDAAAEHEVTGSAGTGCYPECWVFDVNRRVYRQENGRTIGVNPIWREHWRKVEIVGETSRSWLTRHGEKIPKAGRSGVSFSYDDIEREAFVEEYGTRIADAVRRSRDYEVVKRVADLVGFPG